MLFTRAKLSIEPAIREWMDEQWDWLVDKLEMGDLAEHTIIEPTNEFFPDDWGQSREAVEALFNRVVEYCEVDEARAELHLIEQQDEPPPALVKVKKEDSDESADKDPRTEKYLLPVEVTELRDPTVVVAILSRKLALLRLIDAGLDMERDDLPLLTDLACVVLGVGIFNANAAVPQLPR
jgi:hypothetical protein